MIKYYIFLIPIIITSCTTQKKFSKQYSHNNIISYLSSDMLEGRLTGSRGERLAAQYLETVFKALKLKPIPNDNSFFHEFQFSYSSNPHKTPTNENTIINGKNVVGFLNNDAKKTIVIGAHYDHIGRNEYNTSTKVNSKGEIHNGADDNASGVAGLITLAQKLTYNGIKEKTNFIFAGFSGEELGLAGSKKLAEHLNGKDITMVSMINMDMIGRMKDQKIHIGGVGTSSKFNSIIAKHKPETFNVVIDSSGIGPSDYTSFYLNNIPVLSFFTGTHEDYHKPSDDVELINFKDLDAITSFIYNITLDISNQSHIDFIKTKEKQRKAAAFKVTLGIMPNYENLGDGLHIEGVLDGRVADKAGLLKGDVITKINDCEITEIYSYMSCLSKFEIGDHATVTYLRYGKTYKTNVIF